MAGRIIDVTMQLVDKLSEPLKGINANLTDSGKQWQRAGRDIAKTGDSIAKVGGKLTSAVTMPLVGLATGAVTTAANFEAGMSKVQAISGASEDAMGQLNEKAMEMGAKTKFSATEAADAFSYMAMAGWKTEQMMSGIEGVMYLAGATGEDLAMTSDIVTDAMTAFGMAADETSTVMKDGVEVEVSNVSRFVDVLAATANNANTNVSMLGESFKYVAPVAGSLGYSVEDVSTALGVMANSGIKASQGGTALRTLLTNMANPSEKMADAMDLLGVKLDDGEGNMLSFAQVMQDLRSGFGELKMSQEEINTSMNYWNELLESGQVTEDEYNEGMQALAENALGAEGAMKAQAAAMLAGKTGMAGLLAIVNTSDEEFNSLTDAINNSNGACEQMYNITQDNLMGQLTILKSTLESIAIKFGSDLAPMVAKVTTKIQELADKFNSLDPAQRQQIIKWAGIAAAVGPALLVFGKVVGTIGRIGVRIGQFAGAVKAAGGVLAALSGPGAIVVAVVAAIGAAIFLCIKYWDQIKAAAQTAMEVIRGIVESVVETVKAKFEECGVTIEFLKEKLEPIKEKFESIKAKYLEVWEAIKPYIDAAKEKASEVWNFLQPIFQNFITLVKDIFETRLKFYIDLAIDTFQFLYTTLTTTIDMILGVFEGWIDFVVGVFTGDWDRAWNGIKEIFTSVFDGIKSYADGIFQWFSDTFGNIISKISEAWDKLSGFFSAAKDGASSTSIPGNAVGTSYWRGGITKINERGAEIIDLPKGTRIYPHSESLKMAYNAGAQSAAGGGGGSVTINIPKLADNISVRSDSDIDAIAAAIANKLERTASNLGGGEIGYIY